MAFCEKCGAQYQDGSRFCDACGAPAGTGGGALPYAQQPQQQPPVYAQPQQQPPAYAQPQQQAYPQQTQQPAYPQQPAYAQPQQPAYPQQQAYPQQPDYNPYAQTPPAPPKKKRKGLIALIIIGGLVVVAAAAIIIATTVLGNIGTKDLYKMGKDEISSIKAVVGERTVNSYEKATTNGVQTMTIKYTTDLSDRGQAAKDIGKYTAYIMKNDGFIATTSFDSLPENGGIALGFAKRSVDDGKIIMLDIDYDSSGYTLVFKKGEGTLKMLSDESAPKPDSGDNPGTSQDPNASNGESPPPVSPNDPNAQPDDPAPPSTGGNSGNSGNSGDSGNSGNSGDNGNSGNSGNTGNPVVPSGMVDEVFRMFSSGTFHMLASSEGTDIDLYVKDGMTASVLQAEGMNLRLITKDGKSYTLLVDYAMYMVENLSPDDSNLADIGDVGNLVFVGEGSGTFDGKTMSYAEYKEISNNSTIYYFMDGERLAGMRTVSNGETIDMVVKAFDQNIPSGIFDIPSDFELYTG